MNGLGQGINRVFDLLTAPLAGAPAAAMVLLSLLAAALALLVFRAATSPQRLDVARDRLIGHIYEMGLYQDHLSVLGRVQRRLALANLRYLAATLPAVLLLAVPMVIFFVQLESRFAHRPLAAGETTLFSVAVRDRDAARIYDLELATPAGVTVEAGPVRSLPTATVTWRLRVDDPQAGDLRVLLDGREAARRAVRPAGRLPRLNTTAKAGFLDPILAPGAEPLPRDGVLTRATLQLPGRQTRYLGLELDWLLAFCFFSIVGGLALKGPLKVSM